MGLWQNRIVKDQVGATGFRRPKPTDVAHSRRKLLWFLGLYSGEALRPHPFSKIIQLTVLFTLTLLPALMMVKLFSDDHPTPLEGWGILLGLILQLIKLFTYSRSESVTDIENMLVSEIFNVYTRAQDRFVSRAVGHLKIYLGATRIVCWLFSIFFVVFVPADLKSLPLPIWIPVDLSPMFWRVYEVVAFVLSLFVYAAVDSTILALIANAAAQIQILKDNLENSCRRNPEECYPKQEIKIRLRLVRCVLHHHAILGYFNKMEGSLSVMLFCQISFSTIGICVSAFEYHLVPTRSLPFVWCVLYSTGYLMQILTWCMFAEDITVQSSEIAGSCIAADWYACSTATKKILLSIMQRTTEPTILKAGPFFTMSLRTFVMILRSAYTYYAVLHHVYKQQASV